MKKLSTYLLIFFMIIFWGFRVVVTLGASVGADMGFPVENVTYEVILLFVTILSALLVIKRKVIGALLYLITYGVYFGPTLFNGVMAMISGEAVFTTYTGIFAAFLGVVLPIVNIREASA